MKKDTLFEIIRFMVIRILLTGFGGVFFILMVRYVVNIGDIQVVMPDIIWDVILGGVINIVGLYIFFFVLVLILQNLGSDLTYTFETWIGFLAPVTGGAVGAAIGGGVFEGWIDITITGLIFGGLGLPIVGLITEKRGLKGTGPDIIAGLFFGALNGLVLSGFLKLLFLIGLNI